jgi:hypothetical protein
MAMQAGLDSFRAQMQSHVDTGRRRISTPVSMRQANIRQIDAVMRMSEQIARTVTAETSTAQADRVEQMFGQMMAAQANPKLLRALGNREQVKRRVRAPPPPPFHT